MPVQGADKPRARARSSTPTFMLKRTRHTQPVPVQGADKPRARSSTPTFTLKRTRHTVQGADKPRVDRELEKKLHTPLAFPVCCFSNTHAHTHICTHTPHALRLTRNREGTHCGTSRKDGTGVQKGKLSKAKETGTPPCPFPPP